MSAVAGREAPRRQRAADAAIEVIASDGLRGLTHRAVDTAAGLPAGSTSSCFRTRLELLAGVLDRMVELEEVVLARMPPTSWRAEDVVNALTDLLVYCLGPARSRTLARLELYLDAARRAELLPELEAANRRFQDFTAAGLRAAGVPEPEEAARVLLIQLDGVLYDALARPFLGGDQRDRLRRAVETMVLGPRSR
ncbi:TetR/AcrR family transcriptional regulator [Amycolatopsis nigrescens]|uniref:TetR/AcrR family transcriptional regulator n=1 Tax=Amycolatopsis nigrescens TaxID=381445 RepID=UPI00037067C7|nr:TetR/AcrR family transcriptional regulator [Amycolatopsis nigrescens]